MAYRHRKDIRDRANIERSTNMVTNMVTKASNPTKVKRMFHYNLKSSTQTDFDNLINLNRSKETKVAVNPVRRGLGQLTPSNVLTIKGYYDVKGTRLQVLRCSIYRFAKEMNLHIETAFSKDKNALLVRLKRNWPVGVDIKVN